MLTPRLLTTLLCILPAILQSTDAQPHGRRSHRARRDLAARDYSAGVLTVTVSTTIYVDQYGSTLAPDAIYEPVTVTETMPAASPTTTSTISEVEAPATSEEAAVEEVATTELSTSTKAATTSTPIGVAESYTSDSDSAELAINVDIAASSNNAATSSRSVSTSASSSSGSKPGIVYSPYNADDSCKSASDVASDIDKISDFPIIRLYGVDCNQIQNVLSAAKPYGMQLFIGIYNLNDDTTELETLISAVGSDWDYIHTVAIGNEVVNSGTLSADVVVSKVNSARTTLRAAGYTGPVVTADTFVAIMANPSLCEASDYVAANCHPFFDGNVAASGSGDFLATQSANVKAACGGKDVLITETGWPHEGATNGKAVPSTENQKIAIKSIYDSMGANVILFTAFDDMWKSDTSSTYGTEKYWGIQDLSLE